METSPALELIQAERQRQIYVEGRTRAGDDAYVRGELMHAAECYLQHALGIKVHCPHGNVPWSWPWSKSWWKPRSRKDDLVRAGALFLAEIERRGRAGEPIDDVEKRLDVVLALLDEILPQAQLL